MSNKEYFKYVAPIKKIGTSNFVLIPKDAIDTLGLKKGDFLNISISLLNYSATYKCRACEYIFVEGNDYPQCPACGCHDLHILEEEE